MLDGFLDGSFIVVHVGMATWLLELARAATPSSTGKRETFSHSVLPLVGTFGGAVLSMKGSADGDNL